MFKRGPSIAIDLGNNNTILTDKASNSFSEPSFVVLNKNNKSIKAVGLEAYNMFGKVPHNFNVVKPLKGGVIADFYSASQMLNRLIRNLYPQRSFFSGFEYMVSGVPYSTTEVERRALRDTLEQFNSSKTFLIYEPIAAAIGMGLNLQEPDGKFLIDIGGGITEAVVISLSGIVNYQSLKIAGDTFDNDIQLYLKKNYNLEVGINMAEMVKIKVGAAKSLEKGPEPFYMVGKDYKTGIPKGITIDHLEVAYILNNSLSKIEQAIGRALEECPPELASDIYMNGIYLTGGSSLLRGLKERLEEKFRLPVHHDHTPLLSVSKGISTVLKDINNFKPVLFK